MPLRAPRRLVCLFARKSVVPRFLPYRVSDARFDDRGHTVRKPEAGTIGFYLNNNIVIAQIRDKPVLDYEAVKENVVQRFPYFIFVHVKLSWRGVELPGCGETIRQSRLGKNSITTDGSIYFPVPTRLTMAVAVLALLEMVAIPLSGPTAEGIKVSPYWHLAPGGRMPGLGQVVCFPAAR
jgi:hypothetical protein